MSTDQRSAEASGPSNASGQRKKLLERAWDALLAEGLAEGVARQYVDWMRHYVLFHGKQHPQEMGAWEVEQLPTHLAAQRQRRLGHAAPRTGDVLV